MCPRSHVTQTFTLVGMATNQLVHSVHVVFDRWWYVCGPYMCLGSPVKWTSTLVAMSTSTAFSVFDKQWDICVPYTCLESPFIRTSTLVGMSTCLAGSFCLSFFWQVVRHLCSLHVSGIPHHTNFCRSRNVNPKSWFILSVLFWTGSETSVVATSVCDPTSHRPPPCQEHLPNQPVHSVCVFLDRWLDICGSYMCPGSVVMQ